MTDHETFPNSGLSKVRLHLRDDSGHVTETIEVQEHVCSPLSCEFPANCESCEASGAGQILLIGSTEDGMSIFTCYPCVQDDDYAVLASEPSGCPNSWHRMNPMTAMRPCPECPSRKVKAHDLTEYQEVDGRLMKRLPLAPGWTPAA